MEGTLGTAAKHTVILGRQPLASEAGVVLIVGVAAAYFVAARLSWSRPMVLPYFGPLREWLQGF